MKERKVNTSFVDFAKTFFPSFKPYWYQLKFLEGIQNINEPLDIHTIMLKQRHFAKRYEAMVHLYVNLLKYNSVIDLYLGLHFYFETNSEGELELMIDEYSQSTGKHINMIMDDVGDGNMEAEVFNKVILPRKKTIINHMHDAMIVINGMT